MRISQLAFHLFGPPRLELYGETIHIPRRKATALLAYLAVIGQFHSRDALAALLWPENNQSSARAELRRTLSVLKRALGKGWLRADRETICLNKENKPSAAVTLWLDVDEFMGKLKVCESHNHPPIVTCPECLPALEEAVDLYTDDFMAGFSLKDCQGYEEWQFFQREELRRQLTNVLVRLSSHYAGAFEYETAISYARRWLTLDPLHEPAHWHLISLYESSGQYAAALRQYETCRQILNDELGVEPSEETRELAQKIQTSTLLSAGVSRPKSNFPEQATPFIGRVNELAEVRTKLAQDDCRLLTLLGPGGSGKTRLAIEAAGALLDDYRHGVFFVNLAPLEDPAPIPSTIAAELNFSFYEEGSPEEQLLDYLGNKQMLLILDNFEHLLGGGSYVNQILNETPKVKILATSRTSLDVSSENIIDVWGMAYPESPAELKTALDQYGAVKLFDSAAKRRQASFELSDENIPDVVRICALVEGMPLGIVLASSWVKMLSPKEIADEISNDIEFLEKKLQDLPERQQGMRSVFNHSWRLLSESEREMMVALSVFRGGFSREAAQKVAGASLMDLMGLLDKSFLHQTSRGRYEVHELLRQYAAEKLRRDPNLEEEILGNHSNYYCQSLEDWERDLQGLRQGAAEKEMVSEIDNIRTAWVWAVENTRWKQLYGSLNGLCLFYIYRSHQRLEGIATCQAILDKLDSVGESDLYKHGDRIIRIEILKLQARALSWCGFFYGITGDRDLARTLSQKCLSLLETADFTSLDTRFEKGMVLHTLSSTLLEGSFDERKQLAEEAVGIFQSMGEFWWVAQILPTLKELLPQAEAIRVLEDSLDIRKRLGDLRGIVDSLLHLATIFAWLRQFKQAEAYAYEALATAQELSDPHLIVLVRGDLNMVLIWQGRFEEARSLNRETLKTYGDLESTQSQAAKIHVDSAFPDQYLGEYAAAREQAQYAIELLKDVKHFWIPYTGANAIDILGRVALAESAYGDAERWFQECYPIYQAYDITNALGQLNACLGYTARGLDRLSPSQGHFYEALTLAIPFDDFLSLTHSLPGIALLFADQGDVERAVELYALAATHGIVANSKWFDDIAGDQIARAAERLPSEVVEAAKERGRALDLWETARGLLVELEEMGLCNTDEGIDPTPDMDVS